MRTWKASTAAAHWNGLEALPVLIGEIGGADFGTTLLQALAPALPAASWSLYRVGASVAPALLASASHGVPDSPASAGTPTSPALRARQLPRGQGRQAILMPAASCCRTAEPTTCRPNTSAWCTSRARSSERLSIVDGEGRSDELLAPNLYRHSAPAAAELGSAHPPGPWLLAAGAGTGPQARGAGGAPAGAGRRRRCWRSVCWRGRRG